MNIDTARCPNCNYSVSDDADSSSLFARVIATHNSRKIIGNGLKLGTNEVPILCPKCDGAYTFNQTTVVSYESAQDRAANMSRGRRAAANIHLLIGSLLLLSGIAIIVSNFLLK